MEILGVKVDNLTKEEALEKIEQFVADKGQHYIVTPNPEFIVKAQKDKGFKSIINQADLAIADGAGLIFASWLLGSPLKERLTGVDLMEEICQKAAKNNWPVFLLGGGPGGTLGNLQIAARELESKYANLIVKQSTPEDYSLDLYFKNEKPVILFVGLGAPKQEKWIVKNLAKIPSVKLAVGVGGAFDFISGRVRRAPKVLRVLGLEWLWRLCCQPRRTGRIFNAVVIFPLMVVKRRLFGE